jgi:hypothetical protein
MTSISKLLLFLRRALFLRCPECGISPLFPPARSTRSISDWYRPLPGCPRCNYKYEREQGYFLLAIWGMQYFVMAGFGVLFGILLFKLIDNFALAITINSIIIILIGILFIRHAKAFYLAIDHFFDPHIK